MNDVEIYAFEPSDVKALALRADEKYFEKGIVQKILHHHGIIGYVKGNPAIRDYRGKFNQMINGQSNAGRPRKEDATAVSWSLPGQGTAGRSCGHVHSINVCEHSHEIKAVTKHCWKPTCPVCFPAWASRKAAEIETKAQAFTETAERGDCSMWQHIVVSPPQEWAKDCARYVDGYKMLNEKAIDLIRRMGILGGVIIFHPFRENGEDEFGTGEETGNDGDPFKWRYAPHFHVLGYGWLNGKMDKDGWIVKSIASRVASDDRVNVLSYILSHAGVGEIEGRRNIRSFKEFGEFQKLQKVREIKEKEECHCGTCGNPIYKYEDLLRGKKEVVQHTVKYVAFALKADAKEWKKRLRKVHCVHELQSIIDADGGHAVGIGVYGKRNDRK